MLPLRPVQREDAFAEEGREGGVADFAEGEGTEGGGEDCFYIFGSRGDEEVGGPAEGVFFVEGELLGVGVDLPVLADGAEALETLDNGWGGD